MRNGRELFWVLVILSLGLVAAGFAFAAEAKRIKPDQVLVVDNRCIYPHTSAFIFAIVAAVTLLVAHILVNTLTGCICQGPNGYGIPYSEKRSLAITYFFLACRIEMFGTKSLFGVSIEVASFLWRVHWLVSGNRLAFLNSFILLAAGAILNNPDRDSTRWNGNDCYVVGPWLFIVGGLLSIATVVLGANYYLLASRIRNELWSTGLPQQRQDGIAMGQPVYGSQQVPYGAQPYIFGQQGYPQQAYPYLQGPHNGNDFVPGTAPYPIYGQGSHTK